MRIAIIGGGFSGVAVAAQLVSRAPAGSVLYLIEKTDGIAQGVAYSTPFPCHLLNVRANEMGAFADHPEGFYDWLMAHQEQWRQADPAFKELSFSKDDFLPRKLYGLYLLDVLKQTKSLAQERGIAFITIHQEVVDVESSMRVIFKEGPALEVDKVVLATGVPVIKHLPCSTASDRYVANVWDCDRECLSAQIAQMNEQSTVFIIGTGLTMVDMIASLVEQGYRGKIITISYHGCLSASHTPHKLSPIAVPPGILESRSLLGKLPCFRLSLQALQLDKGDWRQLIESLRPYTQMIWQKMSFHEKKQFLRHLFSLWNKHRHRMAPSSATMIEALIAGNRLKVLSGHVIQIMPANGSLEVKSHLKGRHKPDVINAQFVYNCTGPEYALNKNPHPLFHNLLKRGMITKDHLGLGIKANVHCHVQGNIKTNIYALGSLLFGERLETVAVPEIRQQAKDIAEAIVAS